MKNSEQNQQIIVFLTSSENNGTALLRDLLQKSNPNKFLAVDSYSGLLTNLIAGKKKNKFTAIYALSDSHFIFALFALNMLKIKIPVVLGVYHPMQWNITLDGDYSSFRKKVFSKIIRNLTDKNIIFNTPSAVISCRKWFNHIGVSPSVIAGPVELSNYCKESISFKETKTFRIATVGRFVEFKVCTILAMIDVVETLNSQGFDVEYDIYGDGLLEKIVSERINESSARNNIRILGLLKQSEYFKVTSEYDLFFGMGGAVIQAASVGVPSLIAIQGEKEPVTYGLLSDYDHAKIPMFGDPTDSFIKKNLFDEVLNIILMSESERFKVGKECSVASQIYGEKYTVEKIIQKINSADVIKGNRISIFDITFIRLQTYFSRLTGKKTTHA